MPFRLKKANESVFPSTSRTFGDGPSGSSIGGRVVKTATGKPVGQVVSLCVGGELPSGGAPFVPVMEAADLWDRHDVAITRRADRTRNRRVFVERQVSSRPFVISAIDLHHPL
jgi:hypothetical protein